MMKCDICSHSEVCKKQEQYKDIYAKIDRDTGECEADLKCKHFVDDVKRLCNYMMRKSR
jgi:hypothetical protein